MRQLRISVAVVLALVALLPVVRPQPHAQSLATGLFDRYVEALRLELGIPGLSAAIVQNGSVVWKSAFGFADVGASVRTRTDTPYPITNLSETIGAAVLLQQCVDYGSAELGDMVHRWTPFPDATTLGQALAHLSASDSYSYSTSRFSALSGAAAECVKQPYARLVATRVFDYLAMTSSVPGSEAVQLPTSGLFAASTVDQYNGILRRMALPYRGESPPARSDYSPAPLTAASGIISTVEDLAKFDIALSDNDLLSAELVAQSFQPGPNRPTGLGWFIQSYGSGTEKLVWHYGVARDAYSSLILKVPGRRLTLILLANSDGLANGINTTQPDITQSAFARTFLRLFVS